MEPMIIPPRQVMFAPPPALLFLPDISTALLIFAVRLGPMSMVVQLIASGRMSGSTAIAYFSSVVPVRAITFTRGSGEGVAGGAENAGVNTAVELGTLVRAGDAVGCAVISIGVDSIVLLEIRPLNKMLET